MIRIAVNVADIRAKPKFKSERLTQALYNEKIEVLESGDEYSSVRLPDGYEGFINNRFFAERKESAEGKYIVSSVYAAAFSKLKDKPEIATLLPFSCRFDAIEHDKDFLKLTSSLYGEIFIKKSDVKLVEQLPKLGAANMDLLCQNCRKFIGVPYLWGGKSFFGFDCSGFVQVNYSFFGIKLPRDTKDQIKVGIGVEKDEIEPGDLLFFKRHVGIAVSKDEYIHSSVSENGVHISSLKPGKPNYLKSRAQGIRAIRRIIEV